MALDLFGKRKLKAAEERIESLSSQVEDLQAKGVSFLVAGDAQSASRNLLYLNKNNRDADNNSIVMACVGWAMRNIKYAMPVVEKETQDGWEVVPKHPCADVVRVPQGRMPRQDRTRMTGSRMAGAIVHQLLFDGNGYQHKMRNASGQVIGLQWLPAYAVDPVERRDMAGVVEYYEVSMSNGLSQKVSPEDMVHHQIGVDPRCPVKGISPLKSVMRQVLTDNEIAVYSHSVVKMPTPGLIVSPKSDDPTSQGMSLDEADHLAEVLQAKTSGEKAGGVVVTLDPVTVDHMRLSPDQMAIDKINKLPEERITGVFGIPAIVVGMGAGLERSTFSNMAEAREAAAEEFLLPMWMDFADTYTADLLEDFGDTDGLRFWYDTSQVRSLMEDKDATHKRVREDFNANLINRAEARTKIGEEPQKDDEKVWAYTLKPMPMAPPGMPQGPKDAEETRRRSEKR